jgi:hypothetical protein
VRIVAKRKAQPPARPGAGVVHPDPRRGADARVRQRAAVQLLEEEALVAAQIDAVRRAVDRERLGEAARSGAEVGRAARGGTPGAHRVESFGRLERAQQHGGAGVRRTAHHVHAVVHPVGEVHVREPAAAPHRCVTRGAAAAEGVRGAVDRPEVRLDLHDLAGEPHAVHDVHEPLPEQATGRRDGVGVEVEEARHVADAGFSEGAKPRLATDHGVARGRARRYPTL